MNPEAILRLLYAEMEKGNFSKFGNWLRDRNAKLSIEQRREVIYRAIYAAIKKREFYTAKNLLQSFGSELLAEQRREVVYRAIDAAVKRNDRFEIRDLLKSFGAELSDEQRREVAYRAIDAAIKENDHYEIEDLLKSFGAELSDEQRREVAYRAIDAAIKKNDHFEIRDLLKSFGAELSDEQRREVAYRAIHVNIKGRYFSSIRDLLKSFGAELSAEQCREVIRAALDAALDAIATKGNFYRCEESSWVEEFGSQLSDEEFIAVICRHLYAAIEQNHFALFLKFFKYFHCHSSTLFAEVRKNIAREVIYATIERGKLDNLYELLEDCSFCPELSDKEFTAVIRQALYATIEQNCFASFLKFFKHPYGSGLSDKELTAAIRYAIYASIKQGEFDYFQRLLELCDAALLPQEMINVLMGMMNEATKAENLANTSAWVEKLQKTKSTLLSWANDQCKKIAKAYRINKITQQTVQAQGEALIAVESIAAAMNQVILAYQDVPPTGQDVVQEVQSKEIRVQKALADLYATVEHAHRTFLSKHSALHQ
jgi:hypothetical protein